VLWMIKSDTSSIRKRMDQFEHAQHQCQLENKDKFSTKDEMQQAKRSIWARIDEQGNRLNDHGERITKLEARHSTGAATNL